MTPPNPNFPHFPTLTHVSQTDLTILALGLVLLVFLWGQAYMDK